ncbi:MAG: hypothetical protein EOS26_10340 [Mesorhizobium sp.]|nr:MAG: hypothetical protein EOS26_10340 [Mesorhizobium sp.]
MNSSQSALLQMHGLTEEDITSGKADPGIRLLWANAHVEAPADALEQEPAEVELNDLQKKYLGDRVLADLPELDRDNIAWLGSLTPGTFTPAVKAPAAPAAEVAKPVEDDATPVVVDAQSVLDPELIKDLPPVRRAGLADAILTVRRGTRIGDSLSQQNSLAQAKFHLAPYIKRKR